MVDSRGVRTLRPIITHATIFHIIGRNVLGRIVLEPILGLASRTQRIVEFMTTLTRGQRR